MVIDANVINNKLNKSIIHYDIQLIHDDEVFELVPYSRNFSILRVQNVLVY